MIFSGKTVNILYMKALYKLEGIYQKNKLF